MNVQEALGHLIVVTESLQADRTVLESRVAYLEKRAQVQETVGLLVAVVVLLAVVFLS